MSYQETLWNQTTPIATVYPYLAHDSQCEVAVVGGGLVAALCAWHLCQAGHDVTLFSRNVLGMGATSASLGCLRFDHEEGLQNRIKQIGPVDALETYRACYAAIAGMEKAILGREQRCDFAQRQAITYATDPRVAAYLKGDYEIMRRAGFSVSWIDQTAASGMFSFPVHGALLYHVGAAEVDPYRLTATLVEDCTKRGMRVYENTEIQQVTPLTTGILLKTNLGRSFRAKHVVVATGIAPKALLPYMSHWKSLSMSTLPLGTIDGWSQRSLLRHQETGLTLRTFDDRLLISGHNAPIFSHSAQVIPGRKRDILRFAWLESTLKGMFPTMASGIRPGYRFIANYSQPEDGLPLIGKVPSMPGVYSVASYGTQGANAGWIAGSMLVSWLRGEDPEHAKLYALERI